MQVEQLWGTWKLLSMQGPDRPAHEIDTYGWSKASGFLIYTSDGYMSANIAAGNRPKFKSNDRLEWEDQEKVAAYDSFASYAGKYELKGDNKVLHYVEVSNSPNQVGTILERLVEVVSSDRMILSASNVVGGKVRVIKLEWLRLSMPN